MHVLYREVLGRVGGLNVGVPVACEPSAERYARLVLRTAHDLPAEMTETVTLTTLKLASDFRQPGLEFKISAAGSRAVFHLFLAGKAVACPGNGL